MAKAKLSKTKGLNGNVHLSGMQLIVYALVFGLIGGLISWAAFAQGNPHGGGGGGSTASVTATPNPAAANGAQVTLSGCGYNFSLGTVQAQIVHSAGYTESFYIPLWSTGCLDNSYFLTKEAGTYTINMYQKTSTHKGSSSALEASTVLQVQ